MAIVSPGENAKNFGFICLTTFASVPIKVAQFEKSSAKLSQCPETSAPEYAFIGRSNVGKSSLINLLTNRKNLAKTSAKPGKTQLINHFLIDGKWYLVDLPGYGYAQRSKSARVGFQTIIEDYILERQNLVNLFVLIDSRHPPQKIDLEFLQWLGEAQVPFSMVFTKIDKQGSTSLNQKLQAYNQELLKTWAQLPPQFSTSALKGTGGAEILNYINSLNGRLLPS